MSTAQVLLRVFARCPSAQAAPALQARLLQALASVEAQVHQAPQRYWKMPELFEFTLTAGPAAQLAAVRNLSARGWTDCGDEDTPSWVWNAEPGASFLHPDVAWAEVLLLER